VHPPVQELHDLILVFQPFLSASFLFVVHSFVSFWWLVCRLRFQVVTDQNCKWLDWWLFLLSGCRSSSLTHQRLGSECKCSVHSCKETELQEPKSGRGTPFWSILYIFLTLLFIATVQHSESKSKFSLRSSWICGLTV
jgi:hypothetical protein